MIDAASAPATSRVARIATSPKRLRQELYVAGRAGKAEIDGFDQEINAGLVITGGLGLESHDNKLERFTV